MVLLTSLSGYQGSVSVCKGSEETVLEVSHQVHDVVPEARGAQDHHRWVWTGVGSSPHTDLWSLWCWLRFLFLPLCCSLRALTFTLTTRNGARERRRGSPSSTGTWKTETCSDGRTDGHKRTEKTKCAAVDIPRLNSKLWIEIVMCSRNPLLRLETGVCIGCISNVKPLLLM